MEARETEQMEIVMELTGCGAMEAAKALADHKEVWLAVDALLAKPVVSGERYIPKKPSVDHGLSDEQKERCDRGRWLQEQVNAVFSVAHSKTRTQPDPPVPESPRAQEVVPAHSSQSPLPVSASPQGVDGKTPLLTRQSESLH
jgi:hypothetical protein